MPETAAPSSESSLLEQLAVGATLPIAPEPVTLVIFGGAGDLARRKLLPALYNLHVDGLLPPRFVAVGVGRNSWGDDGYRNFAREGISEFSRRKPDDAALQAFVQNLFFASASIDESSSFAGLGSRLDI